ncbi:EamA family transporter [Paenibacillus sp. CC-CFT747]|nr:EamA family transporter [Paenibacillus sp. CC-CFT747]
MTLQYLSPLSLLQVSSLGFVLGQLPDLLRRDRVREEWSLNGRWILLGSLLSPGSYLLFLFAVDSAPVSHLAPIREIGTVFAALLGVLLLKEKQGSARIAASIVIAGGIMVLGFRG